MGGIRTGLAVLAMLLLAGCVGYPSGGYYGGYPDQGYPGQGYPGQGYPQGGGYGGDYGGSNIRCESNDGRTRRCGADTRGGVTLVRQLSKTHCAQGRNWGWDNSGIWVSQGCRAEFVTGRGGGYTPGWPSGPGVGQERTVRCESNDGRSRRCDVDTRGGVTLTRQLSNTRCTQGRNWGWDDRGIWVSQGCRAEFVTGRGGGWSGNPSRPGDGYGQTVRCESHDNRQRRCSVQGVRSVELVRQLSSTRCVRGQNWNWDRNGIWVDRGCRAEFSVR
ncbi:MAG TPA: DUF3011 domain-containing protein [Luteimonas sp.]|nr:DUF3011 domain-containing protein [Luteimonas sp.]HRO26805.1 DUF3011 domain-containing protein [Luteimonas sp.]HRP73116.1 DUF3011 domain-containing protein [Luteimonas sp.]